MSAIPKEINYLNPKMGLPQNTQSSQISIKPISGNTFRLASSTQIQFDLPSNAFLRPDSLYLRYKINVNLTAVSNPATANYCAIVGTPAFSPLARLDTYFGSQIVETINNYNVVNNMLINNSLDTVQKFRAGVLFGNVTEAATSATYTESENGRFLYSAGAQVNSFGVVSPINCVLSNAANLIPLFAMPTVRVQFTLDDFSNVLAQEGTATATYIDLSDVELVYTSVDFGAEIENTVRSMGAGKFFIPTTSYSVISQSVPAFSGNTELSYSMRLSSVKSMYFLAAGTSSKNKLYDSYNITTAGTYQFSIGGLLYPQIPISSANGAAIALYEEMQAKGASVASKDVFSTVAKYSQYYLANNANLTTNNNVDGYKQPASFVVGYDTEKLKTNDALLSGVSTQNSNVGVRLLNTANSGSTLTGILIAHYDGLIEIDTMVRNASIKI